jgi:hypothetical protein
MSVLISSYISILLTSHYILSKLVYLSYLNYLNYLNYYFFMNLSNYNLSPIKNTFIHLSYTSFNTLSNFLSPSTINSLHNLKPICPPFAMFYFYINPSDIDFMSIFSYNFDLINSIHSFCLNTLSSNFHIPYNTFYLSFQNSASLFFYI